MALFVDDTSFMQDWLKESIGEYNSWKKREMYMKLADKYNIPDEELEIHAHKAIDTGDGIDRWWYITHYPEDAIEQLADVLQDHIDSLTLSDARDLLIFCLFDEVDTESGHILCDFVLCGLIKGLLSDSDESKELLQLWYSIRKWYA